MTRDLDKLLKAADPAAGDPGLSRADSARMKKAMLDEAGRVQAGPGWIPILAGGAVAAVVLLFVLAGPLPDLTGPPREAIPGELSGGARALRAADERMRSSVDRRGARPTRRIQFTTRGGTRILWTLDPDFDV